MLVSIVCCYHNACDAIGSCMRYCLLQVPWLLWKEQSQVTMQLKNEILCQDSRGSHSHKGYRIIRDLDQDF